MTLKDLILAAGSLTKNAYLERIRVTRVNNIDGLRYENQELSLNLKDILSNGKSNIKLQDKDSIYVYSINEVKTREKVTIKGEVKQPGEVYIGRDMTLEDAIRATGGLTVKAFIDKCEIVRYHVVNGERKKRYYQYPFSKSFKV